MSQFMFVVLQCRTSSRWPRPNTTLIHPNQIARIPRAPQSEALNRIKRPLPDTTSSAQKLEGLNNCMGAPMGVNS